MTDRIAAPNDRTIEELKAELREEILAELRAEIRSVPTADSDTDAPVDPEADSAASRRQLLRRGGVAVGAGLAAAAAVGRPVAATDNSAILQAQVNDGTTTTFINSSGANVPAVTCQATATTGTGTGLSALTAAPNGTGIDSRATSLTGVGTGVFGEASGPNGTGMYGRASFTGGSGIGVFGESLSNTGTGVVGEVNRVGARDTLIGGVVGTDDGTNGNGVQGGADGFGGTAVRGTANGSRGVGVSGTSKQGVGVVGRSDDFNGGTFTGRIGAVFAGSTAALQVTPNGQAPTQRTDAHEVGEIDLDDNGDLWLCTASGTPGTWRKLTGANLQPVTPFRVYDSRFSDGPLTAAAPRVIPVRDSINVETGAVVTANAVPAGATGFSYNLTIVSTVGAGFLSLTPGNATALSAASINWAGPGLTVGNGGVAALDSNRQIKIFEAGAAGSSTQAILDVTGFFI